MLCILYTMQDTGVSNYSLYSVVLILFMSHHHLADNLGDKLYASVCESVFTTIITIISLSPVSSPHSLDALRLSTIKTLQCQDDLHETVVIYSWLAFDIEVVMMINY